MNQSDALQRQDAAVATFPEYRSRWKLARDLGVFELKLAVDGLKDLVLAPLALAAVIADMVMPAETRGVFLHAVIAIGERFERWLNLYGLKRRDEARTVLDEGGSDVIVDYVESKTLDLHRGIKDRKHNKPKE
ncbi:MAG: hypothetical protein KJO44_07095 [Gemmatimonadetes bacterium]|nr:hypothetical protein [Gemmatimonadota bacterium]MBT8477947.1 hypothetical protein [Gemmatimonadota bacterium]NNK49143.1 hypothetical protein [Gemmatimonadota bacterium]